MYTDKITRATLYGNNNVLMLKGFLFAIKRGPIKTIAIYAKKNIVTGIGVAISNQFSTLLSEGKTQEFHSSFFFFLHQQLRIFMMEKLSLLNIYEKSELQRKISI